MIKNINLRLILLVLAVFLISCTKSGGDERGDACSVIDLESRTQKIVQGTECSSSDSPVVIITLLPKEGGVATCSGTMLTNRHVLTAAHCYSDQNITSSSVRVGGRDVAVAQTSIHPQYNGEDVPPQNDVAIITLDRDVATRTVPILLSRTIEPNDEFSIFGFGLDENDISGVLRSGEMKVTGINSQFFFAQFNEGGSTICSGDSGGPAIVKFKSDNGDKIGIIGVNSFGTFSCNNDSTAGFTNLQSNSVLNFLSQVLPNFPSV
jgi:trypsin